MKVDCVSCIGRFRYLITQRLMFELYSKCNKDDEQCCGSGMFIPDMNFPIPDPGSKRFPDPGSASASTTKNRSILTQKHLFPELSEI